MESLSPPPQGDINHGPGLIGALVATNVACIVAVALRFLVRGRIVKSIGWDDWTILFALVSLNIPRLHLRFLIPKELEIDGIQLGTIIGCALDFVEIHYGFGRPAFYLNKNQLHEFLKYAYGEWIQTFATLMFTKISICLFLLRIPTAKALIRPLQAAVVVLVVSNIILTVLWIVQCRPVAGAWTKDPKATCFSRGQLLRIIIAQAVFSAVSDFLFAAFPILILWKVHLPVKSKAALCALMGLGVIVGSCCIVRTVINWQSIPKEDVTFGGIDNWFWRLFEVQLGIITACIPTLRPGYKLFIEKASSLTNFSNSTTLFSAKTRSSRGSRSKHIEIADSTQHTKGSIGKMSKGSTSTKVGSEEIALPEYCQIRKTTTVDVEQDAMSRHSESNADLGLFGMAPENTKRSTEIQGGLSNTIADARQYHIEDQV